MASITQRPNGHHWVFFGFAGKRYTVRLGAVQRKEAEEFQRRLERLIDTRKAGLQLDPELRRWIQMLGDRLHRTLSRAGLIESRAATTIVDLTAVYIQRLQKRNAKPSSIANAKVVCNNLAAYFGDDLHIARVGYEDTEDFRQWMLTRGGAEGQPLASTTTSRRCRRAREIFAIAAEEGWIEKNPFQRMRKWNEVNPTRDVYVPEATIQKLIDAAPDAEMRLLLAITRFGGLRCPSEIRPLEWSWFDFEYGTFRVFSPKTEHHPGRAWRDVPIFERIAAYVQDSWELALVGQIKVFPNYQGTGAALTGKMQRLCQKVGVEVWPKFWNNLRASSERDLLASYPIDQVAAWLGHSPETALRHYNRVAKEQKTREAAGALRVKDDSPTRSKKQSAVAYRGDTLRRSAAH